MFEYYRKYVGMEVGLQCPINTSTSSAVSRFAVCMVTPGLYWPYWTVALASYGSTQLKNASAVCRFTDGRPINQQRSNVTLWVPCSILLSTNERCISWYRHQSMIDEPSVLGIADRQAV